MLRTQDIMVQQANAGEEQGRLARLINMVKQQVKEKVDPETWASMSETEQEAAVRLTEARRREAPRLYSGYK